MTYETMPQNQMVIGSLLTQTPHYSNIFNSYSCLPCVLCIYYSPVVKLLHQVAQVLSSTDKNIHGNV